MTTIRNTDPMALPRERFSDDVLSRWLPLAGVAYGVLMLVGDFVVDKFPDESTSSGALVRYYAGHHAQVHRGGEIMAIAAAFLGLFVAGLVVRSRHNFGAAATLAVGGAAMLAAEVASASTYSLLGSIGTNNAVTPQALQAWHISGAAFGIGVGTTVFLLGAAMAGIVARALPRWVGWSALVLAIGAFTPVGFLASMLTLLWAAAAGVALAVRPLRD